jgi:hypothetical protein
MDECVHLEAPALQTMYNFTAQHFKSTDTFIKGKKSINAFPVFLGQAVFLDPVITRIRHHCKEKYSYHVLI